MLACLQHTLVVRRFISGQFCFQKFITFDARSSRSTRGTSSCALTHHTTAMKFARFFLKDDESRTPKCGVVVDAKGTLVELQGVEDLVAFLASGAEAGVEAALGSGDKIAADVVQLLAPVAQRQCGGIFCVGMNYVDHCTEQNFPIPEEPIIFNKLPRCIRGPGDDLQLNDIVPNLDFEVELAIVIGKTCRYVAAEDAPKVVAGYTVAHDVSARNWQLKRNGSQWFIGKTFESFAPIGPYLVTQDAKFDPNNTKLGCKVNGASVQDSSTKVRELVPTPCSKTCRR